MILISTWQIFDRNLNIRRRFDTLRLHLRVESPNEPAKLDKSHKAVYQRGSAS